MPVSKSLYQSYTGGQEDRRSQLADEAMQQSALNQVAQAEQERKARTGKSRREISDPRARALQAMANPAQFGKLYPAFAQVSKRVPMAEEMATRAFNQENNKHFMRQKADEMRQRGDLQSARRYADYALEMESKQKNMQAFAMDNAASELDEDAALISNIRDPSTYMFAKHLAALRGRELNLPDAYTEETGEMLHGRMIDIENARETIGLQRMVIDDEERFISGKKSKEQEKVRKGIFQSDIAQIHEGILQEYEEDREEAQKEILGAVPANYRRVADGSVKPIPGGPADLPTKRADIEARAVKAGFKTAGRELQEIRNSLFTEDGDLKESVLLTQHLPKSEGRGVDQKIRRSIEVVLRARTGAAAPAEEVANYLAMFKPSPLDSNEGARAKMQALEEFVNSVGEIDPLRTAPGTQGSAEDIVQGDLTPEEQAELEELEALERG